MQGIQRISYVLHIKYLLLFWAQSHKHFHCICDVEKLCSSWYKKVNDVFVMWIKGEETKKPNYPKVLDALADKISRKM
jgi:hypothetical protein